MVFPLGDASFADEIVSFEIGKPAPRDPRWGNPKVVVGPPDFNPRARLDPNNPTNLGMGCAGTLVVRFADNALVDVTGPELYMFEVGPAIEPTRLCDRCIGSALRLSGATGGTHVLTRRAIVTISRCMQQHARHRCALQL